MIPVQLWDHFGDLYLVEVREGTMFESMHFSYSVLHIWYMYASYYCVGIKSQSRERLQLTAESCSLLVNFLQVVGSDCGSVSE